MKSQLIKIIILTILSGSIAVSLNAQASKEETQIRSIIQEEDASWTKGDAVAYSKYFETEGTFTNIRGEFVIGHQSFQDKHDHIFKTVFKGTVLKQDVKSLKFIKPDVAIVETTAWVSGFVSGPPPGVRLDAQGRLAARLLQVMKKDGNEWKIYSYHNVAVGPGVPTDEPK